MKKHITAKRCFKQAGKLHSNYVIQSVTRSGSLEEYSGQRLVTLQIQFTCRGDAL